MADGDFRGQEVDEWAEELQRRQLFYKQQAESAPNPAPVTPPPVQQRRGVGRFIIPRENTWAAHRALVLDPALKLRYYAENYPYFDDIFHQRVNYTPIWDGKDSRYEGYGALRENVAILRNYIMSQYFADGSVDPNDLKKVKHMAQISEFLVAGVNNDRLFFNPFAPSISVSKANLPGTGVQYLYKKILARQRSYQWWYPILRPFYFIMGKTWKDWDLPPLDASPFSDEALRQPPPQRVTTSEHDIITPPGSIAKDSRDPRSNTQNAAALDALADDFNHSSEMLSGIETLQEPTRRESIDLAKDILNKLKLMMGASLIENGLTASDEHNKAILDVLKGVVKNYETMLHNLHGSDPHIMANPAVISATNAIGTLGYVAKLEVLRAAEQTGNKGMAEKVRAQIAKMPDAWKQIQGKKFGQLFDALESGINTVLVRMQQVADRDSSNDQWLGFSNSKSLGNTDPSKSQAQQPQKAMADNDYYRQFNAQKAQRQQVVTSQVATRQRAMHEDDHHHAGPNASARKMQPQTMTKASKDTNNKGLDKLIAKEQVASLRQTMATPPDMQAVQVSMNRRNALLRSKEQQEKNAIKIVEQNARLANRNEDAAHHTEKAAADAGKALNSEIKPAKSQTPLKTDIKLSGVKSNFDPTYQADQAQLTTTRKRGPQTFGM
jgi:hypothetical protein